MKKLLIFITLLIVPVISVYGQGGGAPTLRVVTEDPSLPSELFYGDTKVKPVRLRPGTNTPITIHDSDFFVQQQYLDFLNRFPDSIGFAYWMDRLTTCAATPNCSMVDERIRVAAGFFYSNEFLLRKGYFVYRFYSTSLGRRPKYVEMVPDMRLMGKTDAEEEAKRVEFINLWMQRPEFKNKYDSLTDSQFVNTLLATAGVTLDPNQFTGKTRHEIL